MVYSMTVTHGGGQLGEQLKLTRTSLHNFIMLAACIMICHVIENTQKSDADGPK